MDAVNTIATQCNIYHANAWILYGCLAEGGIAAGTDTSRAQCFLSTDALTCSIFFCCSFAIYSFVWSIICNNVSKVDQIWSITPFVYSWIYFFHFYFTHNGEIHFRLLLVTLLMTMWGVRLTYNFARRGGYGNFIQHEEDYRWPILRDMMNLPTWLVFNLTL